MKTKHPSFFAAAVEVAAKQRAEAEAAAAASIKSNSGILKPLEEDDDID